MCAVGVILHLCVVLLSLVSALSRAEEDMLEETTFQDFTGESGEDGEATPKKVFLPDDTRDEEDISEHLQRAYDWLEADDPAFHSDDFSGPEDDMFY